MSGRPQVNYVFDVHPLISYARFDGLFVPSMLATSVERNRYIAVSTVTLAYAYRELSEDEALVLDMLSGGHLATACVIKPLDAPTARRIGRQAHDFGHMPVSPSLSTLHAAEIAEQDAATVVTGDRETVRSVLGPDWPIFEV